MKLIYRIMITIILIIFLFGLVFLVNPIVHVVAESSNTLIIYPTDDSDVMQRRPDRVRGSSDIIIVSNQYGSNNSTDWGARGLIRFNLSSIPKDIIILSAKLNLFFSRIQETDPYGREISCYRILNDWDEKTIHWNNKPSNSESLTSSAIVPASVNNWIEWNVTNDVQSFINGSLQNYGWMIIDTNLNFAL